MKKCWFFYVVLFVVHIPIISVYGYDFSVWQDQVRLYQCHGDADGIRNGTSWVGAPDLEIIRNIYFGHDWPAVWPGSMTYDPRADFDRNFVINDLDRSIIETWYGKPNVPADCGKKLSFQSFDSQNLLSNTYHTINWTWRIYTQYIPMPGDEDYPGTFSLYYSTDSGQNWIYMATVSAQTSYNWLVPQVDSNNCKLEIVDDEHSGLQDISLTFKIHQCNQTLTGDFNNDCYVNIFDLAKVVEYWLGDCSSANGWCQGTDFDTSTIVDFTDYSTFAQNWQLCSNPYDSNCP